AEGAAGGVVLHAADAGAGVLEELAAVDRLAEVQVELVQRPVPLRSLVQSQPLQSLRHRRLGRLAAAPLGEHLLAGGSGATVEAAGDVAQAAEAADDPAPHHALAAGDVGQVGSS